mgnify:CR=1 FL=1
MAIKRYIATKDNTITNAYKTDLSTRATGSNMGGADILETFSIYAQASSGSTELSRILIKFPISDITTDRSNSVIPGSGSVNFYLRMFNARHAETLPRNLKLVVSAIASGSWDEGHGMDMDEYTDETHNATGSNWINYTSGTAWTSVGGDYYTDASSSFTVSFDKGNEDLELNVTQLVEQWLSASTAISPTDDSNLGSKANYGVGIYVTSSQEAYFSASTGTASGSVPHNPAGSKFSYYTKKFFGKSTEFFFKRPLIEARWDSTKKDDRSSFYYSSSLAPPADNLNTLYLYNYIRGQLRNIPGIDAGSPIYVNLYSGSSGNKIPPSGAALVMSVGGDVPVVNQPATGGWVATGIYSASIAVTAAASPLTKLFDVWSSGTTQYHTGVISPITLDSSNTNPSQRYITSITNLRDTYSREETARFRLFSRKKDWSPTIYNVATSEVKSSIIESGSYSIRRVIDDLVVVQYGTGSDLHTQLSFDVSGSYFDFDMAMLESGYAYGLKFAYYNGAIGDWVEQPDIFKFRVD